MLILGTTPSPIFSFNDKMKAPIVTFNYFYLLQIKVFLKKNFILYYITKTHLFESERNR